MARTTKTDDATSVEQAPVHEAILSLVASEPGRAWRGSDIVDQLAEHRVVDVMVALAVLCGEGRLERVDVATYKAAIARRSAPVGDISGRIAS